MAGVAAGEYVRLDTVVYTACDMLSACDQYSDLGRAAQWCRVADEFLAQYGCPFLFVRCRAIYGGILMATGDWAGAERELLHAVRLSEAAGPALRADTLGRLAELRLRQGRVDEAEALLDGYDVHLPVARPLAALRLAQGRPDAAVAVLERRLHRATRARPEEAVLLGLLVEAYLARGDRPAAEQTVARLSASDRQRERRGDARPGRRAAARPRRRTGGPGRADPGGRRLRRHRPAVRERAGPADPRPAGRPAGRRHGARRGHRRAGRLPPPRRPVRRRRGPGPPARPGCAGRWRRPRRPRALHRADRARA